MAHPLARAAQWLGLAARSTPAEPPPAGVAAQLDAAQRDRVLWTAPNQAPRIAAVFTSVGILATAIEQLSIGLERNNVTIEPSGFVSRPDPDMPRSDWLHQVTVSLALHGNAYLRTHRDQFGHGIAARILDPLAVTPYDDRHGVRRFHYDGRDYDRTEVAHLRFLMLPGKIKGLGPIQAAQAELSGHRDVTEASANWFRNSGTPAGVLSTEQNLTPEEAATTLEVWNSVPAGRTRLATGGAKYSPIAIDPASAQFLETRRFSKTEILDLFGIPASLALGIDKGDSETYANVEQDWLGFVRFKLMRYVRAIEGALTDLTPRGQEVRLNLESLLRADTKTRYEVHAIAINAGIYGTDYAREVEHLPAAAAPTTIAKGLPA